MPEVIEKYNLYDIGFDKFLSRKSYFDSDEYQEESSSLNSIFNATSPSLNWFWRIDWKYNNGKWIITKF